MDDISSCLLPLTRWGREFRFGNLIKQGRDVALYWYTVELGSEVFAFDAMALVERISGPHASFEFSGNGKTSIEQAATLAEQVFPAFANFEAWVRAQFHSVNTPDVECFALDIDRLSKALAEPLIDVPQGLSREELRHFIQAHADGPAGSS